MGVRAKSPCRHAGCTTLVDVAGYCAQHHKQARQQSDARRGSASERGYNGRWQKARATWLSRYPLCAECERSNRVAPASVVDHIVPHRGDQALFWDTENWQSLCKPCHDRKTAREDGGFGRPGVSILAMLLVVGLRWGVPESLDEFALDRQVPQIPRTRIFG
jgi:5-methylcytosine-specific restriction enzyme A